uniref:E3 ubiquitin ligase BIG BROTHER isoform X1 n=1 Tax=Populus alba TaxID=43335 RepID=A0A4U5QA46_POPAL|nr:E3 ubiquitin ligase BIG BROTHER isoform X1 [Populus alba]
MKGNRSGNYSNSNSWDTLESRLYNCFFGDADRITDSLLHYGRYSQYEAYVDEFMTRKLQNMSIYGRHSGRATNPAWEGKSGGTAGVSNVQTQAGAEETNRFQESLGSVSLGVSQQAVSRLPIHKYSPSSSKGKSGGDTECVICKMEYERGDRLITLPCAHQYHEDCIKKWLEDHKDCCVCKEEVSV